MAVRVALRFFGSFPSSFFSFFSPRSLTDSTGTCEDGINRFGCVCPYGYDQPRCQTRACLNATTTQALTFRGVTANAILGTKLYVTGSTAGGPVATDSLDVFDTQLGAFLPLQSLSSVSLTFLRVLVNRFRSELFALQFRFDFL
jgi:hypothetical protein